MESGSLGAAGTADLLRRYADSRATGCLRLERGHLQARAYFRDGSIYSATAPGARARLGDRLVGAEHITEDELAATLEHQRSLTEPRRIGELLIEGGHIDRETMRAFVREQSTDSVAVALSWPDGGWSFSDGEEVPEDVPLDMSVENLVMEGARRLEEWTVIQERIGSTEAVPDFVPRDDTAELALTPDEWSMLTRIDGRSTIAEIADESGYSEFDAGRIIYGLLTAGIVTLVSSGGAPEEAAASLEEAVEDGEEPAYDPAAASELFGELGLDDSPDEGETGAGTRGTAPEDEILPAPEPPEPAPTSGDQPAGGVNRNELFREFAALDEEPDEDEADLAPPPPKPPPPPPRGARSQRTDDDAKDKDKDKRRGLFGRRRRD